MHLKLPVDHPIRGLPDDFRLYELVVEKLLQEGSGFDILTWAYATARAERIPTECVSKVLTLIRRVEGLGC